MVKLTPEKIVCGFVTGYMQDACAMHLLAICLSFVHINKVNVLTVRLSVMDVICSGYFCRCLLIFRSVTDRFFDFSASRHGNESFYLFNKNYEFCAMYFASN